MCNFWAIFQANFKRGLKYFSILYIPGRRQRIRMAAAKSVIILLRYKKKYGEEFLFDWNFNLIVKFFFLSSFRKEYDNPFTSIKLAVNFLVLGFYGQKDEWKICWFSCLFVCWWKKNKIGRLRIFVEFQWVNQYLGWTGFLLI